MMMMMKKNMLEKTDLIVGTVVAHSRSPHSRPPPHHHLDVWEVTFFFMQNSLLVNHCSFTATTKNILERERNLSHSYITTC